KLGEHADFPIGRIELIEGLAFLDHSAGKCWKPWLQEGEDIFPLVVARGSLKKVEDPKNWFIFKLFHLHMDTALLRELLLDFILHWPCDPLLTDKRGEEMWLGIRSCPRPVDNLPVQASNHDFGSNVGFPSIGHGWRIKIACLWPGCRLLPRSREVCSRCVERVEQRRLVRVAYHKARDLTGGRNVIRVIKRNVGNFWRSDVIPPP